MNSNFIITFLMHLIKIVPSDLLEDMKNMNIDVKDKSFI